MEFVHGLLDKTVPKLTWKSRRSRQKPLGETASVLDHMWMWRQAAGPHTRGSRMSGTGTRLGGGGAARRVLLRVTIWHTGRKCRHLVAHQVHERVP